MPVAIEAGQNTNGAAVAAVVRGLVKEQNILDRIQCDYGSEFVSKVLDKWVYKYGITMDFSNPGKPGENAIIEWFNGTFQDECPNVNWCLSTEDAREKIENWRKECNAFRPHSSVGDLTPQQFAEQFAVGSQGRKTSVLAGSDLG
jgi:putative transposase